MGEWIRTGIDVDQTLLDYYSGLVEFYNQTHGMHVRFRDLRNESRMEVFGFQERQDFGDFFMDYFASEGFGSLDPIPGATKYVPMIAEYSELEIITARPSKIEWPEKGDVVDVGGLTENNLAMHFDVDFSVYNFLGGAFGRGGYTNKRIVCNRNGIDIMIEDSDSHASLLADGKIHVILLCSKKQPYNRATRYWGHPYIHPVRSWRAAAAMHRKLVRMISGY